MDDIWDQDETQYLLSSKKNTERLERSLNEARKGIKRGESKKEKVFWILNKIFMSYFVGIFIFIQFLTIILLKECFENRESLANEPEGLLLFFMLEGFLIFHSLILIFFQIISKRRIEFIIFFSVVSSAFSYFSLWFAFSENFMFLDSKIILINLIGRSILSLLSLIALFFILKKKQSKE